MLRDVAQDGMSLEMAPEDLKSDPEIVQQALKHDARALQFASAELRNKAAIVRVAIERSARGGNFALQFASEELQDDYERAREREREI